MEVHHHPHVEKKNFKEYFLEFLMIFLAVTMGFFAESIRERLVNNGKEKHYMESMVQDLKRDTSEMSVVMHEQKNCITKMDSALAIPTERLTDISSQDTFYHHFIYFYSWVFRFFRHDNTITQLKNAGGFSVFPNKDLVDSISELDLFYEQQVKLNGDYYNDFWKSVVEIGAQLMKMPEPPVLLNDTIFNTIPNRIELFTQYGHPLLEQLYSWIRNEKGTLLVYMDKETKYNRQAIRLMDLISKEYNLKTE